MAYFICTRCPFESADQDRMDLHVLGDACDSRSYRILDVEEVDTALTGVDAA